MFCTQCGERLDDSARFCTSCGKPRNRNCAARVCLAPERLASEKASPDHIAEENCRCLRRIRRVFRYRYHADASDLGGAPSASTAVGANRLHRVLGCAAQSLSGSGVTVWVTRQTRTTENDRPRPRSVQLSTLRLRYPPRSDVWLPSPAYSSFTFSTLFPLKVTKTIFPGGVPKIQSSVSTPSLLSRYL